MQGPMRKSIFSVFLWASVIFSFALTGFSEEVVRVGFFPNVTHAQALVAANMSREGKGWFEAHLGTNIRIEWFAFNAGPSAMEAIFSKSIDLTYVGPSPALNAYLRSNGEEIRVLAGAAQGGDALVVRNPTWKRPLDLRGKIICTPQLGNTQDVACRAWFINQGLRVTLTGGAVRVIPMDNPDIFVQFYNGFIDGAWTVEPWVSRLLQEANGHILYSPKDSVTTILVSSVRFFRGKPELARKFRTAHQELTEWIKTHPEEAQKRICDELSIRMKRPIPLSLVREAWGRLRFESSIEIQPFEKFMQDARLVGISRAHSDLSKLIEQPSSISAP